MATYARREGGAYARGELSLSGARLGIRGGIRCAPRGLRRQARLDAARRRCQRDDLANAREIPAHRNIEAHAAVQRAGAERARKRRLLLWRFELDEAGDARSAAVVNQPESVHRPEGLAQREHALDERVEVARIGK